MEDRTHNIISNLLLEEQWKKKMSKLLQEAQIDPDAYGQAISELERRYKLDKEDRVVRVMVHSLRKLIWPEAETKNDPFTLDVITDSTFQALALEANYHKFVENAAKKHDAVSGVDKRSGA